MVQAADGSELPIPWGKFTVRILITTQQPTFGPDGFRKRLAFVVESLPVDVSPLYGQRFPW